MRTTVLSFFVLMMLVPLSARPAVPIQYKWMQLKNGMPVLLIPVKENPVISSTIVMKVGLKYENKTHNGVSHLLEHLMFNGTENRTQKQLYDDLDRAGCYSNASTGDHYTAYYSLSSKEDFPKALAIQADMLFHSTLPENKVPKEKSIVIQEIQKDRMSPSYEEGELLRKTLFPHNSYGMKVLGNADSVKRIPREEILRFYHKYYAPSNAVAVVVGDFNEKAVMKTLENVLGKIPAGDVQGIPEDVEITTAPGMKVLQAAALPYSVYYRVFQCARVGSKDFGAQEVGAELLDRALKQKFSDVDSRISCSTVYTADYGLVEIRARVKGKDAAAAFNKSLTDFLTGFRAAPGDVSEIVNRMLQETVFSLERPHFFGMLFAPKIAAGLKNPLYPEGVSKTSVDRFVHRLNGEDRSISIYIQGREEKQ
ncbi:MAG: insulinase family protein [Acidobacteria bacterium]|nr:insulinase family protein [Acidobacteriota bacterium]